jgi:hypothetical protein
MSKQVEIPIAFFEFHQLGLGSVDEILDTSTFDNWNGDYSFLDGGIENLRSAAGFEGTTQHLRLALEYFIAAEEGDLARDLSDRDIVLGELVGAQGLAAVADDVLHDLAAYVRRKLFPELGEMTVADKREALSRVHLTTRDLRDWMYHLVFPDDPPLTNAQCRDPQAMLITNWMFELRKQKAAGGPHWPNVPIVFPPLPRVK